MAKQYCFATLFTSLPTKLVMYAFLGLRSQKLVLIFLSLLAIVFSIVLPIVALIDIIRSDFKGQNDKVIWVLIILFLNLLGAGLYFFIDRNQRVS